jgi:dTDP-4-dehydrorhamnose 3,5-epimerase
LFNHESEGGIQWNDPDINIDWRIKPEDVILECKRCIATVS